MSYTPTDLPPAIAPFPCVLSIPHGGRFIPDFLRERIAISEREWWVEDADAYTREIYDLGPRVRAVVASEIVRCVVDLNRAPHDRPPENRDGVVKSHTCYGREVYRRGMALDATEADELIAAFHAPYHESLARAVRVPGVEIGFDCHSMAAVGPEISPDRGQVRPMVALGNLHGAACPDAVVERLAACFREAFELPESEVRLNVPFAGGFITKTYAHAPVPWVQIEFSRALYLAPPWFDADSLAMDAARVAVLKARFGRALELFFAGDWRCE